MITYFAIGGILTGAVFLFWWFMQRQVKTAKQMGAVEERARVAESARQAEQDMGDAMAQKPTADELRRRFDDGSF